MEVQYDGEYVLNKDGQKDFGEITAETRLQGGVIRLRVGYHDGGKQKGRGEKHIERPDRLAQLQQNGYKRARDFVEHVAKNYDTIYPGKGGGIIVAKKETEYDPMIFVELTPCEDGEFYDVTSGLVANKRYLKKRTPLWEKPKNGVQYSDAGRAPTSRQTSPNAI